ncbi:MAG TPA: transcription antitermination factor NusB [bacterium]|mgnify:CR=1 FL=1|nr:transcription antitermination factor NusB [bacterium]HOL34772.1 transcription antitermination factor NusB [bacterium]HPP07769.1 transcription antitermination factor NusB [bacterium]
MKKTFRSARIAALKACYQLDIQNSMVEEKIDDVLKEEETNKQIYRFSRALVTGVIKNLQFIDGLLAKYCRNWDISRLSYIDRNILRIAIYEMAFVPETPDIVAINEAIEISKIYSSLDAGKFINGVLDSIRKELVSIRTR